MSASATQGGHDNREGADRDVSQFPGREYVPVDIPHLSTGCRHLFSTIALAYIDPPPSIKR